jgi:hemolysin activation/secretion protein
MRKKIATVLSVLLLQTGVGYVAAAGPVDEGAVLKRSVENAEYYRLERESREKNAKGENVRDKTGQPPPATGQAPAARIFVKRLAVDPSAILTADEVREIAAKYENREVGIGDLYAAVADLNALYARKKYITARAVLPPQKVENGTVRIQLVESKLGAVVIEGNRHTRTDYIADRVPLAAGELIRLDKLDEDIGYFNRTNDIALRAELRPGKTAGTTDIYLKVEEPANFTATVFADNSGRQETGLYRYGLMMECKSLLGYRDSLVLAPLWAQGTMGWSAAYTLPINKRGTKLGLGYDKNQTSIIAGPFESLDIKSRLSDSRITLSHPTIVKPRFKMDIFAEYHDKQSGSDFSGATLVSDTVKTAVLGVTFQTIDDSGFWYSRFDLTRGIVNDTRLFIKHNASLVRQEKLPGDKYLIYRLAGQVVSRSHSLPSSEQFAVGGMSTVRGFTEGVTNGDQGYLASIELNFPVGFSDKVRGIVFFDHGAAFPYRGVGIPSPMEDYLTSAGVGATVNFSKNTGGKFIIGLPINPPPGQKHVRIHAFLQSTL